MSGATAHEVAWVAAALRQAAAAFGVELPADYSRGVAAQALARGEEVGVTRLGRGVVISGLPPSAGPVTHLVVGYADADGQWYRDGRRHRPSPEPTKVVCTALPALGAIPL